MGVVGNALDLPRGTFALVFHNPFSGLFTYGGYFALGIYAQARGWFQEGRTPGLRTFGILLGVLVGLGLFGFGIYQFGQEAVPDFILNFLGNLFGTLLTLWFLVIFTGLAYRFMNRPSALNARLAANSYTIYLIHYPLILVFRLLLLNWDGSAFIKFPVVLLLAGLSSYAFSECVIGRFPRFAAAGLVGLNLLLFVVGLPRAAHSHLLLERQDELHAVVPDERPQRVEDPRADSLDTRTRGTPKAAISWEKGTLYFAFRPGGLHALLADGTEVELNPELELADIAPLPGGKLAAVDLEGRRIVELDAEGQVASVLVDSADSTGTHRRLTGDGRGGIFFTAEGMVADGESRLYVATQFGVQMFSPAGRLLRVVNLPVAPDWRPKKPLSCVFGGEDMSTLYVACGDEVFAVLTRRLVSGIRDDAVTRSF